MARGQQGASKPDAKLPQAVAPGFEGVAAASTKTSIGSEGGARRMPTAAGAVITTMAGPGDAKAP